MTRPHELPIPPVALEYPSQELLRLWLANQKQHMVLNIGFWEERGIDECWAWGVVVADMIHHIATAHEEQYGRERSETMQHILDSLHSELEHPISARLGEFVNERRRSDGC